MYHMYKDLPLSWSHSPPVDLLLIIAVAQFTGVTRARVLLHKLMIHRTRTNGSTRSALHGTQWGGKNRGRLVVRIRDALIQSGGRGRKTRLKKTIVGQARLRTCGRGGGDDQYQYQR